MKPKQFMVVGIGRFGSSLATSLYTMGHDVLVIDNDAEKIQDIANRVTHALQADSTSEKVLKSVGVTNFDVVVVAIGEAVQNSILTTLLLKEMGAKYLVAKARTELHGKVLVKIGVDRVIFPERDMGTKLAQNLVVANLIDFIELSPSYTIIELIAPERMIGKSLKELNLRAKYGVNVIAIRSGEKTNISPSADDLIKEKDVLVILGENKALTEIER